MFQAGHIWLGPFQPTKKIPDSLFTTRQLFFTHPHQYAKRLLLVHHQTIICY